MDKKNRAGSKMNIQSRPFRDRSGTRRGESSKSMQDSLPSASKRSLMDGEDKDSVDEGGFVTSPYRQDELDDILLHAKDPNHPTEYDDLTRKLIEFGVTVYEITHESAKEGGDLFGEIKMVAQEVSNQVRTTFGLSERCLLFIDKHGRPFNLCIAGGSSGLTGAWKSNMASFSGFEATVALTVLTRSFSCAVQGSNT